MDNNIGDKKKPLINIKISIFINLALFWLHEKKFKVNLAWE